MFPVFDYDQTLSTFTKMSITFLTNGVTVNFYRTDNTFYFPVCFSILISLGAHRLVLIPRPQVGLASRTSPVLPHPSGPCVPSVRLYLSSPVCFPTTSAGYVYHTFKKQKNNNTIITKRSAGKLINFNHQVLICRKVGCDSE